MSEVFINIAWAIIFTVVGGFVGICLILLSTLVVPRILARLTPSMNEDKEIARGNQAVAEYFGRIVAATIIGVSIVIAASIFAGVMAALY
jgi:ABC-type antimicrobial peptide transport system permease subunit